MSMPAGGRGMTATPEYLLLACVSLITTTTAGCAQQPIPVSQAVAETESEETDLPGSGVTTATHIQSPAADNDSVAEPDTETISEPEDKPEKLFRISEEPLEINRQRLGGVGIHVLESRRLILLTDLDPQSVRELPNLADDCFDYLERICGPLRPSRSGAEFQAVGCLISDFELFQLMGLVPGPVVEMQHGQQFGYQFWIRDQPEDYYRRHLLLHEFVHVYMTCDTGLNDIPDGWFMEGAAEVFATHTITSSTTVFGVLPAQFAGFEGWGRISTIRRRRLDRIPAEFTLQSIPSINQIRYPEAALARDDDRYSWWWALSWMLCNHPDYSADWTRLCRCRGKDEFRQQVENMNTQHEQRLSSDWMLFAESLCENFHTMHSFPHHRGSDESEPRKLKLRADRGWQDSGWNLTENQRIAIECSGRCIVKETTAPWYSEPNGVTLEYNQGRPLGEVIAVLVGPEADWISQRIIVGDSCTITAPRAGRLWLQINDAAGTRAGNSGSYHVHLNHQLATGNHQTRATIRRAMLQTPSQFRQQLLPTSCGVETAPLTLAVH